MQCNATHLRLCSWALDTMQFFSSRILLNLLSKDPPAKGKMTCRCIYSVHCIWRRWSYLLWSHFKPQLIINLGSYDYVWQAIARNFSDRSPCVNNTDKNQIVCYSARKFVPNLYELRQIKTFTKCCLLSIFPKPLHSSYVLYRKLHDFGDKIKFLLEQLRVMIEIKNMIPEAILFLSLEASERQQLRLKWCSQSLECGHDTTEKIAWRMNCLNISKKIPHIYKCQSNRSKLLRELLCEHVRIFVNQWFID